MCSIINFSSHRGLTVKCGGGSGGRGVVAGGIWCSHESSEPFSYFILAVFGILMVDGLEQGRRAGCVRSTNAGRQAGTCRYCANSRTVDTVYTVFYPCSSHIFHVQKCAVYNLRELYAREKRARES